jgi:hypothetical protein
MKKDGRVIQYYQFTRVSEEEMTDTKDRACMLRIGQDHTKFARTSPLDWPSHDTFICAWFSFNFFDCLCFLSSEISLDKFTQWSLQMCFGFSFLDTIIFFILYLLIFSCYFNVEWKASFVIFPKPPW